MKRSIARLLLVIPLCGVLVAGLLSTAWIVLGKPTPAKGAIWFELTQFGDAAYSASPTEPFFFLALGNDGRTDADKGLGDAIHVIGVNPATRQATIINVPRDTTAPSGDKINAYHGLQGLPGIVDQLNTMMGIKISYAITTNFPGLIAMIDSLGGIDINIPPITDAQDSTSLGGDQQYNDSDSGAVFPTGLQHLNGVQALAFSRDRKDFNLLGDIARSSNQGLVILSTLATLRAQSPGDATTMHYVAILAHHVRLMNVDLVGLWRLGRLGLSIDPATIKNITIPVGAGTGSNLVVGPGGAALFADFADDAIVQTAG